MGEGGGVFRKGGPRERKGALEGRKSGGKGATFKDAERSCQRWKGTGGCTSGERPLQMHIRRFGAHIFESSSIM